MALTNRQQAVLQASLQVLDQEGLPNFTLKKVSVVLGVTDAALYKHFADKTALFTALADLFKETTLEQLKALNARQDLDALGKFEEWVKSRARQFQENRAMTVALFSDELFRGEAKLAGLNSGMLTEHAQLLQQIATEGQKAGLIREDLPAAHVVMLLTGPMRLMVTSWKNDPDQGPPLVKRVEAWWTTFLKLVARTGPLRGGSST